MIDPLSLGLAVSVVILFILSVILAHKYNARIEAVKSRNKLSSRKKKLEKAGEVSSIFKLVGNRKMRVTVEVSFKEDKSLDIKVINYEVH